MLRYVTTGSANQPAVCFLHGFMGSAADWRVITDALATDAYCIAVDLPGHGASTGRDGYEYSMEGTTQALADVLDDAGVDRCTLVGYSMGGRVALYFAVHHAKRICRLVLESTSPGINDPEARDDRLRVDRERAAHIEADYTAFLQDWYRMPLFASLERHDLVDTMVQRRADANAPSEVARALRGLGPGVHAPLWDALPGLSHPVLVLTGALDAKYVDVTAQVAARNDRIRRVVVPDAGHNVHAERPQAFLAHLVDFIVRG